MCGDLQVVVVGVSHRPDISDMKRSVAGDEARVPARERA
jgi:hypothetical protein